MILKDFLKYPHNERTDRKYPQSDANSENFTEWAYWKNGDNRGISEVEERSLEITLRIERKKDKINNSVEIYHIFNWTRRKRGEVQ